MSSDKSASQLSVKIGHRVGALVFDVDFVLTQSWTVLFGPSGSGKSTLLRTIAGFVQPNAGRIAYGANVLLDRERRVFVPPHARPIRSAGQSSRLFPNMTVEENLLYGCGSESDEATRIAEEAMTLFRLRGFAQRRPRELSGGERQRVAVARAAVSATTYDGPEQALLLLDEPFAGLDLKLRDELLIELRAWVARWKIPVLSVTHDVGEAFQLEAEVIRIADGRIVRQGPVGDVLSEERRRLIGQLQRDSSKSPEGV
jgi:molybdate transport system ATP-binding protein